MRVRVIGGLAAALVFLLWTAVAYAQRSSDVASEMPYVFTSLAGSTGGAGSADGVARDARFAGPVGVAVDASGNTYVADTGNHTIRKITPQGLVTTIAGLAGKRGEADGTGSAARFFYPSGIAIDASGNILVSDNGNDTIRMVTPRGVVSTLAGKAGKSGSTDGNGSFARFNGPGWIAVDASENVYVVDGGNHAIRKIWRTGETGEVSTYIQFYSGDPECVAFDASGNFYFSRWGAIVKVTPTGVWSTFAGSTSEYGTADGTGSAARFFYPRGIAADASGNVVVTDTYNHTIRRITPEGVVSTLAGAAGHAGWSDGAGSAARFSYPVGIAVDASGNIVVADASHTIRTITTQGFVSTVAGLGIEAGSEDAVGSDARFLDPCGIAVDRSGNAYVADRGNHTIRRITMRGEVTTFAGLAGHEGSADGTRAAARFSQPGDVAIDSSSNLYVADTGNSVIRRITPEGVVSTFAGVAGTAGWVDGIALTARFDGPTGVAIDASGNVYVADRGNHVIRKITPQGLVSTLAGKPGGLWANPAGYADGQGSAARFHGPRDVATDASGNVYVADELNYAIRKITPQGLVSTFAGQGGHYGFADGVGGAAQFNGPKGIAVDTSGNAFVADDIYYGSARLRKITPEGLVTTLEGKAWGFDTASSRDANRLNFGSTSGVAVDASGSIYVTDTRSKAVRRGVRCPAGALCLDGPRFSVALSASDPRTGTTGSGLPLLQTDLFGAFSIPALTSDEGNPEVFVKVLDGRPVNGKYWVFYGGLTDFEYTVEVTQRSSGAVRQYTKAGGEFCGGADTSAFSDPATDASAEPSMELVPLDETSGVPSAGAAGECDLATELCLLDGGFALSIVATDPRTGATGSGLPIMQSNLFGYFAIPKLTSNPDNPEMFVKMLDGRSVNGRFWLFYGGLTDFEVTLTVRETATGAERSYTKPGNSFCGGADTGAF